MQEYQLKSFLHVDSKFLQESLNRMTGFVSQMDYPNGNRKSTPRDAYPNKDLYKSKSAKSSQESYRSQTEISRSPRLTEIRLT